MSLGERIKRHRVAKGMSQARLGELIGVSQNTISGWENERTEPSRADIRQMADALDVDISLLELGDGEQNGHKVRLMGFIGAGQAIEPLPGGESFEDIDAPPGAPDGAEAAIVRGGSMYPLLRDGFMLVWWRWTPDPSPHIGELCFCKTTDGGRLVKIIEPGTKRGHWNLVSLAAGYEPMRNVRLEGVAPVEIIYRKQHQL